jgi:hypothetical protein
MATITDREAQQIERANTTGRAPVVFVHGLWLLPGCWERWATVFEDAGYAALTPAWPDDRRPSRRQGRSPGCSPARRSSRSPIATPP